MINHGRINLLKFQTLAKWNMYIMMMVLISVDNNNKKKTF